MGHIKFAFVTLLFLANTALAGAVAYPNWFEGPNDAAGDRFSPQNVTGGPWGGFSGMIGDGDLVDAFRFSSDGGTFEGNYVSTVSTVRNMFLESSVATTTFSAAVIGPILLKLTPTGPDAWELPVAGVYIFELSTVAADPPFSFTLTPLSSPILAAAAIPEPGTWALMLAGLVGIGVMTRRRISH